MNLNKRLDALEQQIRPERAALPPRLAELVDGQEDWLVLHPLTDGDHYAWPAGPYNREHMRYSEEETVPPGAQRVTQSDCDALLAANVQVIKICYDKNWRDGLAPSLTGLNAQDAETDGEQVV